MGTFGTDFQGNEIGTLNAEVLRAHEECGRKLPGEGRWEVGEKTKNVQNVVGLIFERVGPVMVYRNQFVSG